MVSTQSLAQCVCQPESDLLFRSEPDPPCSYPAEGLRAYDFDMAGAGFGSFVHQVVSSKLRRPNGVVETTHSPAVWMLAHRACSCSGRLDLWVYPTKSAALKTKTQRPRKYFSRAQYSKVLTRYQQLRPVYHVLRVLPAWIQRPQPDGLALDEDDDD